MSIEHIGGIPLSVFALPTSTGEIKGKSGETIYFDISPDYIDITQDNPDDDEVPYQFSLDVCGYLRAPHMVVVTRSGNNRAPDIYAGQLFNYVLTHFFPKNGVILSSFVTLWTADEHYADNFSTFWGQLHAYSLSPQKNIASTHPQFHHYRQAANLTWTGQLLTSHLFELKDLGFADSNVVGFWEK